MGFLNKLFNKPQQNAEHTEAKFYQRSDGEVMKEVNGTRIKLTPKDKEMIEQGKIQLEKWPVTEEKVTKKVPQPGEIFDVEGRASTINEAGVVVKPTKEQLEAATKKEEANKEKE